MAVTIHTTPQAWSPSDNPLTFVFSSNQTAQPNFSYIVRTFFNGVQVAEDQVFIEVSTRAHIDVSPNIKNLMPKPTHSSVLWRNAGINAELYVVVYEKYGTTPALQASATSSTIDVFKSCLSDEYWEDWDYTDYKNLLFLTNYPRTERLEVMRGQDVYLNMICDASKTLIISMYRADDSLIGTYNDVQTYHIAQINTKTDYLQATAGFSAGDIADSAYYTVRVGSAEIFTIYFKDDYCGDIHSLLWLNEYGSFDTFVFEHNLELSGTTESNEYGKQFGKWSGTSFIYDATDSGTIKFSGRQRNSGTIYTGWITETQQNWLVELYNGLMYRIYYLGGSYKGIKVTSTQFTFQQQRFEELISEAVQFEISANDNAIRL